MWESQWRDVGRQKSHENVSLNEEYRGNRLSVARARNTKVKKYSSRWSAIESFWPHVFSGTRTLQSNSHRISVWEMRRVSMMWPCKVTDSVQGKVKEIPIYFILCIDRLFKFIFTFYLCMCVDMDTCVWVFTEIVTGCQVPCNWSLQVFNNHPVWVPGIDPQFSGGSASTLNHLSNTLGHHEFAI